MRLARSDEPYLSFAAGLLVVGPTDETTLSLAREMGERVAGAKRHEHRWRP